MGDQNRESVLFSVFLAQGRQKKVQGTAAMAKSKKKKNDAEHKARIQEKARVSRLIEFTGLRLTHEHSPLGATKVQ